MSVKQISVFLENRPGALQAMTAVLAENGIDMQGFSLAEASDFGIARIIVNDVYKTTTVLRDASFVHNITPVIGVSVPDVPGGLDGVLEVLAEAGVNVEYMYAILGGKKGTGAYMIFRVADETKAAAALSAKGLKQLTQEELEGL